MDYSTRREALAEAQRVFKGHGLRGARIRVWENMGWHFNLQHLHYGIWYRPGDRRDKYWGLCMLDGKGSGDMRFANDSLGGATPKKVVEKMRRAAIREMRKDQRLVNYLGASLAGPRNKILIGGRP